LTAEFVASATPSFIGANGLGRVVDSKAMRKVEDGQDLIRVVETSSISLGVAIVYSGRALIKLH